jgi:tetratricopeptide (TPR) repeat protein
VSLYMTWLAEVHVLAGSFDEALVAVDEALAVNPQELFFRPETVRVRGQIVMRLGRPTEAKGMFLEAITLSSQIGAKRFNERAIRSLRLLLEDGAVARAGREVPTTSHSAY